MVMGSGPAAVTQTLHLWKIYQNKDVVTRENLSLQQGLTILF